MIRSGRVGFLVPNSSFASRAEMRRVSSFIFEPLRCGECAYLSPLLQAHASYDPYVLLETLQRCQCHPMPSIKLHRCRNFLDRNKARRSQPVPQALEATTELNCLIFWRLDFRFLTDKNSQRSTRAPLRQQQRWTMGLSTKWLSFACMNVPADIRKRNLVARCTFSTDERFSAS